MCFAFRSTTSTENQSPDEILAMTNKITSAANAPHPQPPQVPASSMSTSTKSDSDDCVLIDEPPKKNLTPKLSKNQGSAQGSSRVKSKTIQESEQSSEDGEYNEEDENDEEEDGSNETAPTRKRAGSTMEKGSAKKAKPEPSGKGEAYDDLCVRATTKLREKTEDIKKLQDQVLKLEEDRNQLYLKVSSLEKKEKHREAKKADEAKRHATDMAAGERSLTVLLRAELEAKHKDATATKDKRHKDEMARIKQKNADLEEAAKAAKAEAKESKPEYSLAVKDRDKRIASVESDKKNLEGIAEKLRTDKANLKAEKDGFRKALDSQSDIVLEREADIKKLKGDVVQQKAATASQVQGLVAFKKFYDDQKDQWEKRWAIQYENAQNSARRASDTQRSCFTISSAHNACIQTRDVYKARLDVVEDELRNVRTAEGKAKGNVSHQVNKAEGDVI